MRNTFNHSWHRIVMHRLMNLLILLIAVSPKTATGFTLLPVTKTAPRRTLTFLFDPDNNHDNDDDTIKGNNKPASRKFTGYTSSSSNTPSSSPRERMMQREFDLVSLATSPTAFLVQAVSILVVLAFVLYVGATGQLGINDNNNNEDDFIYDPVMPSTVVPSEEFQSSGESVFI